MSKYSRYRYSGLLEFLDFHYECSSGVTNYAIELLRMNNMCDLTALVNRYNTIYSRMLKYLNTREDAGHKDYDEDLNTCFNENLVRLFMKEKNPSLETCSRYLVNIRECPYIEEYQEAVIEKSTALYGDAFAQKANGIVQYQQFYQEAYDELLYTDFEPGSNGYKKLEENVKRCSKLLAVYGYKRTIADYNMWIKTISTIVVVVFFVIFTVLLFRCTA